MRRSIFLQKEKKKKKKKKKKKQKQKRKQKENQKGKKKEEKITRTNFQRLFHTQKCWHFVLWSRA